jgi:ribonuclease D
MLEISTTEALSAFCARAAQHPYVTVDTEFLRERTYYAQLCLIQMAFPGGGDDDAALIDSQAEGISLEPLFDLMRDENVVKVFHAARQDLEILWHRGAVIPTPLFDTQVAAMVCGYGEQVGYETLVRKVARAQMDKSSRFTDWSQRPLSDKQKVYALADVTHLRVIYERLSERLAQSGRAPWVAEELSILTSPDTYVVKPAEAWRRVKTRNTNARFLGVVQALAEWREAEAQARDIPRNRLLKDDALLELAANKPSNMEALSKQRLLLREARKGKSAEGILAAIAKGVALKPEALPKVEDQGTKPQVSAALMDLLKVLLKARCESEDVAQKLVATTGELEAFAANPSAPSPITHTWRRDVFGADALALIEGKIGLTTRKGQIQVIDL